MAYVVFAGSKYYPGGGIEDLVLTTNSIFEAMDVMKPQSDGFCKYDWAEIARTDEKGIYPVAYFGIDQIMYTCCTFGEAVQVHGENPLEVYAWFKDIDRTELFKIGDEIS